MKTYTYSEARQQFAGVLDEARRSGCVQIRRRDGQLFILLPAKQVASPLDVPGVDAGLKEGEIREWLRSERDEAALRALDAATTEGKGVGKPRGKPGRTAGTKRKAGKANHA